MGVYANGKLIYGFIHDDETKGLFTAITEAKSDPEEDEPAFSDQHYDLQQKHKIELRSVGYAHVDILAAFSASAGAKNFDSESINAEDVQKTAEYDARIHAFLADLDIDSASYKPGWHILGYMD